MLYRRRIILLAVIALAGTSAPVKAEGPDHLQLVRAYADAMIEHGRDTYGNVHSPLFAAALDRKTLKVPRGTALPRVAGVRAHDRALFGANPMHDLNLYQVLYALTKITGQERYAAEADKALEWFFEHCQSPATGLMAWGEHLHWDFHTDAPGGTIHEFYRPWVLWDRCFELAPQASVRFAEGLWQHQIADQKQGLFSRHARYESHGPGRGAEYPRHGGFCIAAWTAAYQRTKNPEFLKAIEVLVDSFERRRDPQTGAIPAAAGGESHYLWPTSNLSLAIDLHECAPKVPQKLAAKMLACARRVDEVYLKMPQDLGPDGEGFLVFADRTNLEPNPRYPGRPWTSTWAMRYGNPADAQPAMLCLLRYRQVKLDGYRKLFLDTAERYLRSEPDPSRVIWPGAVGDALAVLLNAHGLTGEQKYLNRADQLARKAVNIFFTDDSPLPKASSQNDHYEAITRPDTLAMELLDLWALRNKPGLELGLIWPER